MKHLTSVERAACLLSAVLIIGGIAMVAAPQPINTPVGEKGISGDANAMMMHFSKENVRTYGLVICVMGVLLGGAVFYRRT
jgi:hypothetical protein